MSKVEKRELPPDWDTQYGRVLRTIALVISVIVAIMASVVCILLLAHTGFAFWQDEIRNHLIGTIGFIGICVISFGIVTFLRQSEGPMEFEALGMKFKGASGQVVLYAFCVVVLSLCAKLLW
ncbi:MAG: hypothetical protein U1E67_20120 [Hyphomicrobiales bacterium]